MKNTMKKLLSLVLVAMLLVSTVPFQALADDDAPYSATFVLKVDDEIVDTVTANYKNDPTTIEALMKYKKIDLSKVEGEFSHSWKSGMGSETAGKELTVNNGDEIHLAYYTKATEPTTYSVKINVKLNGAEQGWETVTIKDESTTVENLIKHKVDADLIDGYTFADAYVSGRGYIGNGTVNAGESVYIAFTKEVVVEPINIVVKVESSDNVVWTGEKVPANGTSAKVEDLLSYCWNKDWDDVYTFDHAWSHEQQKNVAKSGSINAGDTVYIMVNKTSTPTQPSTPSTKQPITLNIKFDNSKTAKYTFTETPNGDSATIKDMLTYWFNKNWTASYKFDHAYSYNKKSTTYDANTSVSAGDTVDVMLMSISNNNSGSGSGTTNKFPYKVYLHIYKDNKVDEPAKTIDITSGIALDGKVTLSEVKTVVKNYYTAKTSDGIGYDGMYLAKGNWVSNFVNDTRKYTTLPENSTDPDLNEMRKESEVHINVMITNASTKSTATADSSNPKTGDTIYMTVTVMGMSVAALAAVYYVSKKRAVK